MSNQYTISTFKLLVITNATFYYKPCRQGDNKVIFKMVIRDELALYICTIKSELLTTSVIDVLIADRHCNIEVNKVFNIGGKNR